MGFGIATQTGVSAAIQSIPSLSSNKGLRNGYGATFAENFTDGTNVLDPRITFSRASNATVTGSNGLIQYAPHNLFTFSEQFDNVYWNKSNISISANSTIAPNGTTTADLCSGTGVGATYLYATLAVTAGVPFYISSYVKNFSLTDTVWLRDFTEAGLAKFDLATGTVSGATSGIASEATIIDVGNGWYRISAKFTPTTTGNHNVAPVQIASVATTTGVYVWGAQFNVGSLQDYYPTTVKNLLGFSEAFDNAAWTKSNSFVQTNLLTYSEQFDNAAWAKTDSTVSANAGVAPNGTMTADLISETASTNNHFLLSSAVSMTSGTAYTLSVFMKKGSGATAPDIVQLTLPGALFGVSQYANYNISTGVVTDSAGGALASISSVGNDWYRLTYTATATSTGSAGVGAVVFVDNNPSALRVPSYAGVVTSNVFLWGAQLVQGSVAGDYQQTTSAALPVQYQAPNGTMTADKLVENTATAEHRVQVTPTLGSAPTTASVYFKASERSWSFIRLDDAVSSKYAYFNLATGVVGTVTAGLTASITSVGNGWYRCSALFSAPTAGSGSVVFAPTTGNSTSSYAGDGTSGIYIWGAQLSDSASLDQYVNNPVAAPSSTAYYGARFDYSVDSTITPSVTNLQTYSEQFDNAAYQKSEATITANSFVAPDSTTTADTLIPSVNTAAHFILPNLTVVSGVTYTASCYARAGGYSFLQLTGATTPFGSSQFANFNLSTGNVGTVTGGTATITNVGNGWYRCSFTVPCTANGVVGVAIGVVPSATATRLQSFTGDGTSGIYIWGAQLETGSTVGTYVPTTSAAASIPPVLGTSPKGLLIEEQRVNLLTFSDQFDNAAWGKTNVTVTANSMVAPDGTLTADTITVGTSTFATLSRTVTSAGSASGNTMTAYVKQGSGATTANVFILRNSTTSTNLAVATLNYSTGVVTQGTGSGAFATNVGNGWYRIVVPATSGISAGDALLVYYGFTGALQTAGDSFSIWGAQLEAGAFATSYIPTTTAQVTRSADVAVVQGSNFSSWYNVNEGSLYSNSSSVVPNNLSTYRVASINDGTTSNQNTHSIYNGRYFNSVTTGGVSQADIFVASSYQQNLIGKVSSAYRINDIALSVNGSSVATDTSATIPTVDRFYIGSVLTTGQINGWVRQIAYYPRRLQNSELVSITS